jgi:DivIVA domain-containing protein
MDEDDPERRIRELEHQQDGSTAAAREAHAVEPPHISDGQRVGERQAVYSGHGRAQDFGAASGIESQPRPAGAGPKRWRLKIGDLLLVVIGVAASLYFFGIGAHRIYEYRVGTPTTATVIDCTAYGKTGLVGDTRSCTGTWNVGGESHTGKIRGDREGYQVGSSVDVRVRGDEAMTATGLRWPLIWGAIFGGLSVVYVWIRLREKTGARAASRPRSSRHSLTGGSLGTLAGTSEFMANTARRGTLTPADVRNVVFSKPTLGKRGYNEDEVDALLDRVHAKLLNPSNSSLAAADIHNSAFSKPLSGKRGYNRDEVDAFLDLVQAEIRQLDGTP